MRVIIILLLLSTVLYAKSYPIIERDFFQEVKDYADTPEFEAKVNRERDKEVARINSLKGEILPTAKDNLTYKVADSYTLPHDIPRVDRDGNIIGILYKKGYRFNPIKFLITAPPPLIIFNACDEKEKAQVMLELAKLNDYMLVSTGCELSKITGFDEMVYLLDKSMVEKFRLRSSISIVSVNIKEGVYEVKVISTH